ncbi:MAG: tRNA pseudouridine(13) synthase TruD [Planctomycetota bacterium]
MKVKQSVEDFQVEEAMDLRLSDEGRHSVYLLEKRSRNTLDALWDLAKAAGVQAEDISFAGLKDRHAWTKQHVSIPAGPRDHFKGRGFRVRYLGNSDEPVNSRRMEGNAFKIVVRDLTRKQAGQFTENLQVICREGVPNFFDEQRFGSARHGKGFIAERMVRGDFESALKLYMSTPARKDSASRKALHRMVALNWGNWSLVAGRLPAGTEKRIAEHLAISPHDYGGALNRIDRRRMSLFLHAWQSQLWNRTARVFLEEEEGVRGLRAVPYRYGEFLFYDALLEEHRERLCDLSIPLLSPSPAPGDSSVQQAVERVLREEELDLPDLGLRGSGSFFKGGERKLLVFPRRLHVGNPQPDDRNAGRRRVQFSMFLPRGTYATIVIKGASAFGR